MIGDLRGLATVELADLPDGSALMSRRDRRYLSDTAILDRLLEGCSATHAVLDIAGQTRQAYRSLYYDTPAFDLLADHRRGRPCRTKVRRRHYVASDVWMLEFKVRRPDGRTVKHRREIPRPESEALGPEELEWLQATSQACGSRRAGAYLEPKVWTLYERTTLVKIDGSERTTIDEGLRFASVHRSGAARMLDGQILVEVKSERSRTESDTALIRLGARRGGQSKYATGAVLTHCPPLTNAFRLFARRHFETIDRGASRLHGEEAPNCRADSLTRG